MFASEIAPIQKLVNSKVDELRIGTEWIDVTGVPKPGTIVLLGLGRLGLLKRKKRI